MHYYQFNIADYRKDTAHLSLLEHGIYRQLLDTYYLDEKPIETKLVIRRLKIITDEEKTALENVLSDFFQRSDCGNFYIHKRIDAEIEKYQARVETAKANGIKGGRPKKTQTKPKKTKPVNSGLAKKTKGKANHKPITNNQEPILKDISIIEFESFWEMYPRKTQKLDAEKAWIKLKPDKETFELIAKNIEQRLALGDWSHDEKQYIPHASTYLNRERWTDEIVPRQASSGGRHSSPDSAVGRVNAAIDQRATERAEAVQSGRVLVHENGAGVEAS